MVLNPDGHVLRTLSVPAIFRTAVTFWRPTIWSPDGRRLAGGAGSDDPSLSGVYTVNSSDGRGLQRVTSGEDNPGAYSPDGTRIEFIRSFADEEPTTAGLFVVESDGSGLTQITPDDLAVAREQDAGDWSPDGSRIVFTAQPAPGHRFALFTVAPDGTGLEQLPLPCGSAQDDPNGHGCFGGSYSADGTRLAYTARDASTGQTHIWIANSDGTDAHRLTTGETFDGQADWRP
jgi:Tol biopolymer transport system component